MAYTLSFDHFISYREVGGTDRPIIVAELLLIGKTEYFPMLLDCGADNVVLPGYLLATFGLSGDELPEEKACTVWGLQAGYTVADVEIRFPDYEPNWRATMPVRFSPYLDSSGIGLLGRESLFSRLRFAFDERSGSGFYLSLLQGE